MWVLDYKESWVPKNWCFWTVVLEKTLDCPLDCKEIKPVNPKGNQFWIFIGRTDAEAEALILWPPAAKNWLTGKDPDAGKDWRQEEMGMTEDETVGWHHRFHGHEFEQAPELVMDREARHAGVHGVAKSWTRLSNWTELKNCKYWILRHFLWTAPWFFGFGKGTCTCFLSKVFTTVLIASVPSMLAVSSMCRAWCCLWILPPQRSLAVAEVVSQARKIVQWAALPIPTKPSLSWLFKWIKEQRNAYAGSNFTSSTLVVFKH